MKTGGYALLADIGGTHARFAVLGPAGADTNPIVLKTADYPNFRAALGAYRRCSSCTEPFAKAAICVAGPVNEHGAELTNCDWNLTLATLAEDIGGGEVVLVNDFTAIALSLTELGAGDMRKIGGRQPVCDTAKAVLGPGTGLGVSGLIADGRGGYVPVSGEGGHVDLSPHSAREMEVLGALVERYEHVSAERVLSGPGLQTLYRVLADLNGMREAEIPRPGDIALAARTDGSPIAVETVALFTGWLGSVAGDLALTLGARGGVYIAGGIVNRWGQAFDAVRFRERFEAKGRFRDYLAPIPTWVITEPHPAFKGLATLVADAREA